MKLLVTGAAGQLGQEATRWFTRQGHTVIALDRRALDLTHAGDIAQIFLLHRPDWVLNCAAYTAVDRAEQDEAAAFAINAAGAGAVARAAAETGCRLLHVSTDFVFAGDRACPLSELDETRPVGAYGRSKLAGETAVREGHPAPLLLRTSWVYSAHGNNFLKTMLRLAGEREVLRVVDDQVGTPTWTGDICRAAERLMLAGAEGLFHFSNEGVASWYDFAVAILEEAIRAGLPVKATRVQPIPTSEYPTPARRPAYSVLSKLKIRPLLEEPVAHWRSRVAQVVHDLRTARSGYS